MSPQRPGGGDDGPDRPGDSRAGRGDDPVDVDAAWADIVARWGEPPADRGTPPKGAPEPDRSGEAPSGGEPAEPDAAPGRRVLRGRGDGAAPDDAGAPSGAGPSRGGPSADGPSADDAAGAREAPAGWADADEHGGGAWRGGPSAPEPDDDHYVPPEPPRSPPADLVTRLAWVGAVAGPLLLLLCVLVWRDAPAIVVAAAVVAFVAGFGVLVARLPRSRDDDDGAVV